MRLCLGESGCVVPRTRAAKIRIGRMLSGVFNITPERPVNTRCGGFTLIEVLVAISLLAISLVVILQLFSGGLNSGKLSDEYTRGVFHAREKMEEILLSNNMEEGITEGEFEDGFRWKADIVRMEQREEEVSRLPFDAFTIAVEISWGSEGHEKHLKIDTIKVAEKLKDEN
jgi:general secretion pathway protein I